MCKKVMYILSRDIDHLEYEAFRVKANEYRGYLASIKDQLNLHPKGLYSKIGTEAQRAISALMILGLINWLCRKMTIMKFKLR